MSTDTLELIETETQEYTTGDPGKASHIVVVPPDLKGTTTPQAYVMAARIEGFPVSALCGYTWVPNKDPKAYPICQQCMDMYNEALSGNDDDNVGKPPEA